MPLRGCWQERHVSHRARSRPRLAKLRTYGRCLKKPLPYIVHLASQQARPAAAAYARYRTQNMIPVSKYSNTGIFYLGILNASSYVIGVCTVQCPDCHELPSHENQNRGIAENPECNLCPKGAPQRTCEILRLYMSAELGGPVAKKSTYGVMWGDGDDGDTHTLVHAMLSLNQEGPRGTLESLRRSLRREAPGDRHGA